MKRVLVVGSATIDRVMTPRSCATKLGGVVTYAGLTYRRHDLAVTVVANLAPGHASLLSALRQAGIDLMCGDSAETTRFVNHTDGEARWQEMPSRAAPITAAQVVRGLRDVDAIHLGPLHPLDIEADAVSRLPETKRPVILDVQGYTRRVDGRRVRGGTAAILEDALRVSTVVKADESELATILERRQSSAADLVREYGIAELIVTCGAAGGRVVLPDGREVSWDGRAVTHLVDSTGAGDVFLAAYMASRMTGPRGVAAACAHAAEIAARQVEGRFIPAEVLAGDATATRHGGEMQRT